MPDNFLASILAEYERERDALLLKIAREQELGMALYSPETVKETLYAMQLKAQGYVELVSLDHHPDYPDLIIQYGATITEAGLQKARELRKQQK